MKISIGADHAGFSLKQKIKRMLEQAGMEVDDRGTESTEPVDYPDFARRVGEEVARGQANCGILVCGTGIGMAIAANKVPGVRAANVTTEREAILSRAHNDANILALGARLVEEPVALKIVDIWLHTQFEGGRHQCRIEKIAELEREEYRQETGNKR